MLGKAISDSTLVDVPLANAVYGSLLGLEPGLEDLAEVDPAMHSSMEWILDHDITVRRMFGYKTLVIVQTRRGHSLIYAATAISVFAH